MCSLNNNCNFINCTLNYMHLLILSFYFWSPLTEDKVFCFNHLCLEFIGEIVPFRQLEAINVMFFGRGSVSFGSIYVIFDFDLSLESGCTSSGNYNFILYTICDCFIGRNVFTGNLSLECIFIQILFQPTVV